MTATQTPRKTQAQDEADRALADAFALTTAAYPPPDAEYLTGFTLAADRHAVRRVDAVQTGGWFGRAITYAVCGKLCSLSLHHGAYDPAAYPFRRCPECAWTVAAERGDLDAEVQRLMPSNGDREVLTRLGLDPLIAVTAAAMTAEAACSGHAEYEADHPATIQSLAAISRHAPVILVPEDCSEGSCEHEQYGNSPLIGGDGYKCLRPEASAACAECSLRAGSWAGEWEGTYEITVPAPCPVLTALAEHAVEALAEAKRGAEAGAASCGWCRDPGCDGDHSGDRAEPFAAEHPPCPGGCGCRLGTDDADRSECGCDGGCCGD